MSEKSYVAKQHRMGKTDYIETHASVINALGLVGVSRTDKEFLAKLIAHRVEYKRAGHGMDFRKWLQIYLDRGFYVPN